MTMNAPAAMTSPLLDLLSVPPADPMAAFAAMFPGRAPALQRARRAVAPTPKAEIARDGAAALYRFVAPAGVATRPQPPVLLVPSMINRWYVLDLHERASLVGALVADGLDVWCLDWGVSGDEDRYLEWDAVVARLRRLAAVVLHRSNSPRLTLVGYCMGATLCAIHAAFAGDRVARMVNIAGPIDFAHAGSLGRFVDKRWFDPAAMTAAGNLAAGRMQAGFVALQPHSQLHRWQFAGLRLSEWTGDRDARFDSWAALDRWASDNVPFPAAAYVRYIRDLYQHNELVRGEHVVTDRRHGARKVDLGRISCPLLTVVASRDVICPPAAATALHDHVASRSKRVLEVPGGHVGMMIGSRARRELYPQIVRFARTAARVR